MMKKDIDLLWGRNPEKVFRLPKRYGWRNPTVYGRIVGKKGHGYLVDRLVCTEGSHTEKGGKDRVPMWQIHKSSGTVYSCKDIDQMWSDRHNGKTLEELADILNAEGIAEWQAEHEKLQVKPRAIAEILVRTNLKERDLQATPEAVLVELLAHLPATGSGFIMCEGVVS